MIMAPSDRPKNDGTDRPYRRRDPTGCQQGNVGADYTVDELELLVAVDKYKRKHRRVFLTCREMLVVIRGLGYIRPGGGDGDDPEPNLYLCGCHSVCYYPTSKHDIRVKPTCPIHRLPLVRPARDEPEREHPTPVEDKGDEDVK